MTKPKSKFNILAKLLPPCNNIFYEQFEQSTIMCQKAANLYHEIMHDGYSDQIYARAKDIKHTSNDIAKNTLQHLNATFVTPIEREDIQHLASLLNKITKRIIKACVNLRTYRLEEFNKTMQEQADTMVKATEELHLIISHLKNVSEVTEVTDSHHRMRIIETLGDEILYKAMDELFSGKYDALSVIKMRDIYKDIESAMDGCFNVSDAVVNVILKHN